MKNNLIIPVLTMALGFGIGVAVDRALYATGQQDSNPSGSNSAQPAGPRAARDRDRGNSSSAGILGGYDRNPAATVRRLVQQLDMSPMVTMDFEKLVQAYESLRGMGPDDIRIALDEISDDKSMNQGVMMLRIMLMGLWAEKDGQAAVEYAMSMHPQERMSAMSYGILGWMRHDPVNAYEWYRNNREKVASGSAPAMGLDSMFISSLARQDLNSAFSELSALPEDLQLTTLPAMAMSVCLDADKRKQFLAELEKLDDESLRQNGMSSLISVWSSSDPKGAVDYLEGLSSKPERYEEWLNTAVVGWAMRDPESALEWRLENVEMNEVESKRIAIDFGQWAARDPDGAAKWLKKQPEEFANDEIYQNAVNASVWINTGTATRWAALIDDRQQRRQALAVIHSVTSRQGEKAVARWMDGLDPLVREEVEQIADDLKSR